MKHCRAVVLLAASAAFVCAQLPNRRDLPPTPIHTRGDIADYGTWALGQGFKASFHDGFVFYPQLGDRQATNVPWRWTTEGVSVGGAGVQNIAAALAPAQLSAARCEYHLGAVTERYDVRQDGVEQTFVVHRALGAGDLTVRGRIASPLTAPSRAAAVAPLEFHLDDGVAAVSYGAALAIDADGRRTPVTTALADERLTLTVPGDWLATARYPVTIDPLISAITRGAPGVVTRVKSIQDGISTNSLLTLVEYATSASDHDIVAYLGSATFDAVTTVFAEASATSTIQPDAAYIGGAQRWMVTYRNAFGTHAYRFVRNDLTFNGGGAPLFLGSGSAVLGGTRDGQVAAVVFQTESGPAPQVVVAFWNPVTGQSERSMRAHPTASNGDIERIHPAVNPVAESHAWLVVWEEIDHVNLTTSIRGNIVRRDGSIGTVLDLTYRPAGAHAHRMRPVVAGMDGRYLVASLADSNADRDAGRAIHTRRVDWADASGVGSLRTGHVLGANSLPSLSGLALAYDDETRSHWGLAYQSIGLLGTAVLAQRLGHTGGVVESTAMPSQPTSNRLWSPSITFDRTGNLFGIAYADDHSTNPVWYVRVGYSQLATATVYGVGCRGSISASPTPHAGHEFFRLLLGGAGDATGSVLMIGAASASLPLDPHGAPGCRLAVSPDPLIMIPASIAGGGALVDLPLPDAPVFRGNLYCQWLIVAPGRNALGLETTPGLVVQVR